MAGISPEEQKTLEHVVAGHVGKRSDAKQLVQAYLDAMHRNAYSRTIDSGPVPTGLPAERSMILIEISRQLGRVVEDFEIQALFRVTPSAAKGMRATLFATYPDLTNELSRAWALQGAFIDGRTKGRTFAGTVIVFSEEDRRDVFVAYAQRQGIPIEALYGDEARPWKVVVSDAFPKEQHPK